MVLNLTRLTHSVFAPLFAYYFAQNVIVWCLCENLKGPYCRMIIVSLIYFGYAFAVYQKPLAPASCLVLCIDEYALDIVSTIVEEVCREVSSSNDLRPIFVSYQLLAFRLYKYFCMFDALHVYLRFFFGYVHWRLPHLFKFFFIPPLNI